VSSFKERSGCLFPHITNMATIVRDTSNKNITQYTMPTGRWYYIKNKNIYLPSSTWILNYYPFADALKGFLMKEGHNASNVMMTKAVEGSKIHNAVADLCVGKEVKEKDKYWDELTLEYKSLTFIEWQKVNWFVVWFKETPITKILAVEKTVSNLRYGYAGTIDLLCQIKDSTWLIDFKTGGGIWPQYWYQIASYAKAEKTKIDKLGLLHLGAKNKKHYKLHDLDDQKNITREEVFKGFLNCKYFWDRDNRKRKPIIEVENYPPSLQLEIPNKLQ